MTPHGMFHWNELMSHDVERDKAFYSDTIGWRFEPMPMDQGHTYWVAYCGDTPAAGIFPLTSAGCENVQAGWMPYLTVDDVDARVARAVKAGAQLMRPIFDVPNVGRIAILREPGGAGIGWITPAAPQQ